MTEPFRHSLTPGADSVGDRWWSHANRLRRDNRGALLISLILTLTVMATLGAAMIYMTTSSGYGFLTSSSQKKAYYIAYSGLTYYDALPVKPTLPQTYRLANGDRFILDIEGFPERFTSTGIVNGPFGDTRFKLYARSSGGTPEWVDTMEDTDNWLPDERTPGTLDTETIDDNAALRTGGESFDLPGAGSDVSLQTAIDDARTIRDDYESQRNGAAPFSMEWFQYDFYLRYWSAVAGALEDARAILIGAGVTDDTVTLPTQLSQPIVFGIFDWRTVNGGGAIPFFDYWNNTVYDGVSHDLNSLSYDLQVKTAVIPNADDYLSGLSLRVDNTARQRRQSAGTIHRPGTVGKYPAGQAGSGKRRIHPLSHSLGPERPQWGWLDYVPLDLYHPASGPHPDIVAGRARNPGLCRTAAELLSAAGQ